MLEPVVAYLLSIVVTRPENEPEAVLRLADAFSSVVVLVDILEEYVLKEDVKTNAVGSRLSNSSLFELYDAEAIDPETIIPPVAVILPDTETLPVTCNDPVIFGKYCSIVLF